MQVSVSGASYGIRPKYLIVCAGTGNAGVLDQLGCGVDLNRPGVPIQARRKNHMVVLRGRSLPLLTAVFPINGGCRGVFLCSRPATGTPLEGSSVTHRFQKLLRRADLPHLRFHDLRHACASLLLAQGVHPRVVMEILGHSQISLTMNTYSHVIPALQRDAAERMGAILAR